MDVERGYQKKNTCSNATLGMEILAEPGRSLGEDHPIVNVEGVGGLYGEMSRMSRESSERNIRMSESR